MAVAFTTATVPSEIHTDAPPKAANPTAANRAIQGSACAFCDRNVILEGHILAHLA
jgi:hypothetical protein